MSGFLDQFSVDESAYKKGTKFDLGDGHWVRLKPMDRTNLEYHKAMEVASRPYLRLINAGKFPLEKDLEIHRRVFIDHIMVDWGGADFGEFTKERALEVLKEFPKLYYMLRDLAASDVHYTTEVIDDIAGKSGSASSMTSPPENQKKKS